jgi:hypothetical protein
LFDYTKFHIGLYTTLAAAYIALMTSAYGEKFLIPNLNLVLVAVAMFVLAGFAGGIIASSCTHYWSFDTLMTRRIFPFIDGWGFRGITWTRIEHTAFWIGIGAAIFSFFPVHPKVTVGVPVPGNATVFEWTVAAGDAYHQLVNVGSPRTILICVDPGVPVEFEVQPSDAGKPTEIGGETESTCQVLYAQTVRGRSKKQPQKGRIAISLAQ